jgi:hypothetical protein
MRVSSILLSVVLLYPPALLPAQEALPQVSLPEPSFHFEILGKSEPVEHTFAFVNNTTETIEAIALRVTPPLGVPTLSKRVLPGQLGILHFRLDEPRPVGDYQGFIEVDFKNPAVSNITFEVTGKITPLIEVKPFSAFFVATARGHTQEASVQLINHEAQPLTITAIECPSHRFSLRLQTNQLGRNYTLSLKLPGEGEAGRMRAPITLHTSSQKEPVLLIDANTYIHERVHTFPDDLDFGTMDSARIRANETLRKSLTQILMVYRDGGTNFQVTARTDLPFLTTHAETSTTGKQVQIEVALDPNKLRTGDFQGHLELVTNDREFSRMEINVKGQIR